MGRASSAKKQRRMGRGTPPKKWIVPLLAWSLVKGSLAHGQDLGVTGNLSVTGSGDINGNLQLGVSSGTSGSPGLSLNYVDGYPTSVPDQIQFVTSRPQASWLWLYTTSGSAVQPQMWLDSSNVLSLYDRQSTPAVGIQLNPAGASIFANSLTVNGIDSRLPNQTLAASSSILTQGLADARYVQGTNLQVTSVVDGTYGTGPAYALDGASATGYRSFANIDATASGAYAAALGVASNATGFGAAAIGYDATATGYKAVALGKQSVAGGGSAVTLGQQSTASGDYAVAVGNTSSASGNGAVAVGDTSSAYGYKAVAIGRGSVAGSGSSVALGAYSTTTGDYSVAGGYKTVAQGEGQFITGQFNVIQGDGSNWVAADDLFQVGNGQSDAGRSNAFSVRKNGETSVFGNRFNFGLLTGQTPGTAGSTGASVSYADGTAGLTTFSAAKAASAWQWQNNDSAAAKPQMKLDGNNVLTIYDASGNPAIVLDPAQPFGAISVLTQSVADGRYVQNGTGGISVSNSGYGINVALPGGATVFGGSSFAGLDAVTSGFNAMALGYGSEAQDSATALGLHAQANGAYSTASGAFSTTTGPYAVASGAYSTAGTGGIAGGFQSSASDYSFAIGSYSSASGRYSVASGWEAIASGDGSFASGALSNASGEYSLASGYLGVATGNFSTASGHYTVANGYEQFVAGAYNLPQGTATGMAAADDLFQIGNGGYDLDWNWIGVRNAFAVKRNGTASVFGNRFNFGLVTGQTPGTDASAAARIDYVDGVAGAVTFSAAKPNSTWQWQNNDGATAKPQMKLDGNNVLTIYDANGTPAIILDPSHPNAGTTVLTESVADARYVQSGSGGITIGSTANPYGGSDGPAIALSGGSATGFDSFAGIKATASGYESTATGWSSIASGSNSTATGNGSFASGYYSTASGQYSVASGTYSTAIGVGSVAGGSASTAIGLGSIASGNNSVASGYESTASGYGATASGYGATANGNYSMASGTYAIAQGYDQFVVGQNNVPQGDPANWLATDDLFQIGNGADVAHPSNAFTVKKNGDTTMNGTATVNGDAVITGQLTVTHVVPQGDLSMGSFTAGQ